MHGIGDFEPRSQAEAEFHRAMARFHRTRYIPRHTSCDLTPAEVHVIMAVGRTLERGENPRPRDIGRTMRLSASALSQTLGSLERKGYITRERSAADARQVSLGLTESGRAFVDAAVEAFRNSMRELREYLGDDDLREFARLLNKVDAFYQEQVDAGKMTAHPVRGPQGPGPMPCDDGMEA